MWNGNKRRTAKRCGGVSGQVCTHMHIGTCIHIHLRENKNKRKKQRLKIFEGNRNKNSWKSIERVKDSCCGKTPQ